MDKNTSNKLKTQKSGKAWAMILKGVDVKVISDEVWHTPRAIREFAQRKFKQESSKLWANEIKAVGECEIPGCKKTDELQAHHLLSKTTWPNLSRDLSNGVCLCGNHHNFNDDISPHTNMPAMQAFIEWLKDHRYGQFTWYEENKLEPKHVPCNWEFAYWELKQSKEIEE
jgi:hypothetical protein